jgi:hypothetical protein
MTDREWKFMKLLGFGIALSILLFAGTYVIAAEPTEKQSPKANLAEYEQIRSNYADTAAAQWELAQWCREHKLNKQREAHLKRVIELEPNHAEARRALGYALYDGKWATRNEIMTQRGLVKHKGQWKTPQEIELLEKKRKQEAAQQEWMQKLRRWRGWLGSDRDQQARENIAAIADPLAVKALAAGLLDEKTPPPIRMLLTDPLAKIDTYDAAAALAEASLYDPVEEIRLTCLDRLATKPRPEIVKYYVGKLTAKKSTNDVINLAAIALGRMKDPSAVGPLIEALVTMHKFKIAKPGGEGAMSGTFGKGPGGRGAPGGSGLSAGGGPTIVQRSFSNQAVLDALVALTGQNFGFDQSLWKQWFAAAKKPPEAIKGRRD